MSTYTEVFRDRNVSGRFGDRRNLVHCASEQWRPPTFHPTVTGWQKFASAIRRFFDLQAGSIWSDLSVELPKVRGTLLDVGCGAYPYRGLLSPQVAVLGIDTVDAKSHFGYDIPDVKYYAGNIWPVENESVDVVLCTETLEDIADLDVFLDEMFRCVRPGGMAVLTVPFAARWHFIPHDYWRFTPSGLSQLLEKAGFINIEVYARGNAVTVASYKQMAVLLPLLMPQGSRFIGRLMFRLLGMLTVPLFMILAIIGNISLMGRGGDDCLGYTAFAYRREAGPLSQLDRS